MEELDTLYAFTDVTAEHVLNIGPGGWGWTPIDSPQVAGVAFVVGGEASARDFQQWHKNEGRHIRRVGVVLDERCPDRWIWPEPIAGTRLPVARELTTEQLAEFQRHWRLASIGPSTGPPPIAVGRTPVAQELTTEQLAQILAENAHRLCVWSPPHTNWQAWPGVASVEINGPLVQLNIETGSDDATQLRGY